MLEFFGDFLEWENLTILTGGIVTLAIFSFLIKENPVYRFFEHLFIGIATGFGVLFVFKNFLYIEIFAPMLGLDIMTFPDGTPTKEYQSAFLLYLIPMAFGLLYYFIYSKKYNWLAKLVIGFSLGASGGLAFKGFFNQFLPQISGSFKPLVVIMDNGGVDWLASFNNCFFVFTVIAVLYYFLFSNKQESKVAKSFNQSGRVLLMVCFGAFFGSTVMARMALLVERLQFLYFDFLTVLGVTW